MATTAPAPTATTSEIEDPTRATRGEMFLTLLGGVWLVLGLFIDGYAHTEIIDTATEDFFTPWHAIFYSGFAFTTGVIGWMMLRRTRPGPVWERLPAGYGWAAIGIVLFAVGGVGDGIWHTVFGVEVGVDALLSPTHLLLFTGLILILTTPLRAHWAGGQQAASWSVAGMAVVSAAIASALVVFFFTYAFGLAESWPQRQTFDPLTGENELVASYGLATSYLATALLVAPTLALLRRHDLPRGAVVVLWALPTLLNLLAFGAIAGALAGAVIGAVVAEVVLATRPFGLDRRWTVITAMTAGMAVTWTIYLAAIATFETLRWPPELWAGQVVMSSLVAAALSLLAFPAEPAPGGGAGAATTAAAE